jgi:hypothetical protein
MQQPNVLLCPPLDDDIDHGDDDDDVDSRSNDAHVATSSCMAVMSKKLHSNFEALKTTDNGNDITTNNNSNSKRKLDEDTCDGDTTKRHRLAQETAALVQRELERWKNSVQELEALLAQRQRPYAHGGSAAQNDNNNRRSVATSQGRLIVADDDDEK